MRGDCTTALQPKEQDPVSERKKEGRKEGGKEGRKGRKERGKEGRRERKERERKRALVSQIFY